MDATIIDSFEFCRLAEQVSGSTPVAGRLRLCADLADNSGELQWSFQGGRHSDGMPALVMKVKGEVRLRCQRCLSPFLQTLESRTTLVLAADELQADSIEERLDDGDIDTDVIVGSKTLDLQVLAEDEAILLLPLSPRHEVCPGAGQAFHNDKAESPFAVLKTLK